MLYNSISHFLTYFNTTGFAEKSLESMSCRLYEFNDFVNKKQIDSIPQIKYSHLLEFLADYKNPSVHIKKQRVWALHQFFHFLKANEIIDKNISSKIPYPKLGKTVPKYLTIEEFNKVLEHFTEKADTLIGLRNLLIIMLLGFLGLRLQAVLRLNIEDVNLKSSLIWIREKGGIFREMFIPQILCTFLGWYLEMLNLEQGPLFLSKRKKRLAERTLQAIFKTTMDLLGIDKHLHTHLFRHTAGTHLNKVAGPEITQYVLGHARRTNIEVYTHLNPDQYAEYMKRHPYHNL